MQWCSKKRPLLTSININWIFQSRSPTTTNWCVGKRLLKHAAMWTQTSVSHSNVMVLVYFFVVIFLPNPGFLFVPSLDLITHSWIVNIILRILTLLFVPILEIFFPPQILGLTTYWRAVKALPHGIYMFSYGIILILSVRVFFAPYLNLSMCKNECQILDDFP